MNQVIHSVEDKEMAERTVIDSVENLRTGNMYLPKHRNRWRKQITNELAFLREEFPESEVLKLDFTDISLVLEKE